jgi:hypothetical protein
MIRSGDECGVTLEIERQAHAVDDSWTPAGACLRKRAHEDRADRAEELGIALKGRGDVGAEGRR